MTPPIVLPAPRRGEIWFVKLPSDPPDKNPRPVVVVSSNTRNQHPRAETVVIVPLSTTLREAPTHIALQLGDTGLREACMAQAENISTVRKHVLLPSRIPLRQLSESMLRKIAGCVVIALGFPPDDLVR